MLLAATDYDRAAGYPRRRATLALVLAAILLPSSVAAEYEKDMQEKFCAGMEMEVYLPNGSRADCIREDVAIEVDFSDSWAEAIGQALHYGAVTERRPSIILVCKAATQERTCLGHKLRLEETIAYWNIGMMVWFCDSRDDSLSECQFRDFFGPE
ncbi:MAG: hypothetical protein WD942_09755 [Dehalococcoidia bacterium]